MHESRRGPDQGQEKLFDTVADTALAIRAKYVSDAAAVNQAMKEFKLNNDPKWAEYRQRILARLHSKRRRSERPVMTSENETPPVVHDIPLNQPRSLKDSVGEAAWRRMLADAAQLEKLHPADARGLEDEAA